VEGKRAAVPFVTISTDWQQWQKRQFLAYPYNVEQYLRQSFAIRLQTTEDWYFLTLCEAALALNPNNIVKGTVITETGAATSAFQKDDLVLLLKVLTKKMVGKTILITQKNIAEMGAWQRADLDDRTMESTGAQGPDAFVSKNYFGLNWIRTIKEDLLQPGNIYLFGPSQMLGVFLTFGGVDFMIERRTKLSQCVLLTTMHSLNLSSILVLLLLYQVGRIFTNNRLLLRFLLFPLSKL